MIFSIWPSYFDIPLPKTLLCQILLRAKGLSRPVLALFIDCEPTLLVFSSLLPCFWVFFQSLDLCRCCSFAWKTFLPFYLLLVFAWVILTPSDTRIQVTSSESLPWGSHMCSPKLGLCSVTSPGHFDKQGKIHTLHVQHDSMRDREFCVSLSTTVSLRPHTVTSV